MADSDGMETLERILSFHIYVTLFISLLFNPSPFFSSLIRSTGFR